MEGYIECGTESAVFIKYGDFTLLLSPETPTSGELEDNFRVQRVSKFTKAFSEIPRINDKLLWR